MVTRKITKQIITHPQNKKETTMKKVGRVCWARALIWMPMLLLVTYTAFRKYTKYKTHASCGMDGKPARY